MQRDDDTKDLLSEIKKIKITNETEADQFMKDCINDRNYLLAAFAEGQVLQKAMEMVSYEVGNEFREMIHEQYENSVDKTVNIFLATENPSLISAFTIQTSNLAYNELEQVSPATYAALLKMALKHHQIAEAIFTPGKKSGVSLAKFILDHATAQSSKEEQESKEEKTNELAFQLFKLCEIHKELTFQFLKSLEYNCNTDMMGPFEKAIIDKFIFTEIEPLATQDKEIIEHPKSSKMETPTKDHGVALLALSTYYQTLFLGLIAYSNQNPTLPKEEKENFVATIQTGIRNYLDCLIYADKAGNKNASKEINENAEILRAFAYSFLENLAKKNNVTFSEFQLVFSALMRIHENSQYSNLFAKSFFQKNNKLYVQGLQLLARLMQDNLVKLPGGNKLDKADIIRAALPFIDEARKLGSIGDDRLFKLLTAELHALEHPEKDLPKMVSLDQLSDTELKANERNYYDGGSSNKTYGQMLADTLEKNASTTTMTFKEWKKFH